jgi:hypothetical protein
MPWQKMVIKKKVRENEREKQDRIYCSVIVLIL